MSKFRRALFGEGSCLLVTAVVLYSFNYFDSELH